MPRRFRPPLFLVVSALIGLMAVLATLQYRWLGRISDAERESRRATLAARAAAFASDFDKELTLAYALFQLEPALSAPAEAGTLAERIAVRYERWQAASRFPALVKDCYAVTLDPTGDPRLTRFDLATRTAGPVEWPAGLADLRGHLAAVQQERSPDRRGPGGRAGTVFVRRIPAALWEDVPALVIPAPLLLLSANDEPSRMRPSLVLTVLVLDREHITQAVLPSLSQQHFGNLGDGVAYEVAVVPAEGGTALYRSAAGSDSGADARADAAADLFQIRIQEFPHVAADVRRFTLAVEAPPGGPGRTLIARSSGSATSDPPVSGAPDNPAAAGSMAPIPDRPVADPTREVVTAVTASAKPPGMAAKWRVMVKHPSGSLEAAVDSTRRRNLIVSFGILAVLGASMALLGVSAKRSQDLARRQMEFVAAVSHELRTPLAVIRSAADNLAHGVVGGADQIKKYGELVSAEGRRLSGMVEQILEFAGVQSGQRPLASGPVDLPALLDDVLASSAGLLEEAGIDVQVDVASDLPLVAGDGAALQRVFQNLIGNAIKYRGDGRWIGVRASRADDEVLVTVADRGLGIAPSDRQKIFEPFYRAADVAAAQIPGAGLGLSLVRRIVEAHGGRVDVASEPGAGSEFTVHLAAIATKASATLREAAGALHSK